MIVADPFAEERLGRMIGLLPPAPEGWVRAAQEIPAFRARLDDVLTRAEADEAFRAEVLADLESAIVAAGHEPEPRTVATLRRLIESPRDA